MSLALYPGTIIQTASPVDGVRPAPRDGSHWQGLGVRLRVAMFLTFSNGRVIRQIDYPVLVSGTDTPREGHQEP